MEVIDQLLKAGVDVNQPNLFGMTSLLLVAGYGNDELVNMVLGAGADADSTNNFGHTALHLAIVGKRTQLKKLLPRDSSSTHMYYNLNRRDIDVALRSWTFQHRDILTDDQYDEELNRVGQFMMMIGSTLETGETFQEETEQSAMKRRVEAVWKYRQVIEMHAIVISFKMFTVTLTLCSQLEMPTFRSFSSYNICN
jgi:Ankyrin repeats (many copies)